MAIGKISLTDVGRLPLVKTRFWNMYAEKMPGGPADTVRRQRWGLLKTAERGDGPVRSVFTAFNRQFSVSGANVYNEDVVAGVVPAIGIVRYAVSEEEAVITVNHKAYQVLSGAVTMIADPDLPNVRDVLNLAGRYIYIVDDDTGRYFYSAVGDATMIDGLAFASAESNPDPLVGGLVLGDNLILFGTKSTEWHYATGDIDAPYQRSRGRSYNKGCASIRSICLADNAGYFLGNDRIFYRTGAVPKRVSDDDMEDRLRQLSDTDLAQVSAYSVVHSGHTHVVANLPSLGSWALDVGRTGWTRWTTWDKNRFRVDCADGDVMGDYFTGKLFKFDGSVKTDDGDPIERVVSAYVPIQDGYLVNFNAILYCARGVGLATGYGSAPVVEMRFADGGDYGDFTPWMESSLGVMGDRSATAIASWDSLGTIGTPGRLFEFRCTDPVDWIPYAMTINQVNV